MGENSAIEWTTHTLNMWIGCVKVSPGCDHCYAEAYDARFRHGESWGADGKRNPTKTWRKPIAWNLEAAAAGRRDRVFCSSLADVFEDNARRPLDAYRAEMFRLIARTPSLDWLLLTKRPGNIMRHVKKAYELLCVREDKSRGEFAVTVQACDMLRAWMEGKPPANVWVGCTVEDQKHAALRIPQLLKVPARIRFLSCEPLLERVDLTKWLAPESLGRSNIDWLIIGGESTQPKHPARPFFLEWARSLIAQARGVGCAPFVKQLGSLAMEEFAPRCDRVVSLKDRAGGNWGEWPTDLRVREFPTPETPPRTSPPSVGGDGKSAP